MVWCGVVRCGVMTYWCVSALEIWYTGGLCCMMLNDVVHGLVSGLARDLLTLFVLQCCDALYCVVLDDVVRW